MSLILELVLSSSLATLTSMDDGCIFHKPRSRWTQDDRDLLAERIRRLKRIGEGKP